MITIDTPILGIDHSKKRATWALYQSGKCIEKSECATPVRLSEQLQQQGHNLKDLIIISEATGVYHEAYADHFRKAGSQCFVLNPLEAKHLLQKSQPLRNRKTDCIDAEGLARICEFPTAIELLKKRKWTSQPLDRATKRILAVRENLVEKMADLKRSFRSTLESVFPEIDDEFKQSFPSKICKLLRTHPTPNQVLGMGLEELEKIVGKKKAPQVYQWASETKVCPDLSKAIAPTLGILIQAIEDLQSHIHELEIAATETITESGQWTSLQVLNSIEGVGKVLAMKLLAYLPESWHQWEGSNRKLSGKLLAYSGLDPIIAESGEYKGKRKISKRGSSALRHTLYQAAYSQTQHHEGSKARYQKAKERKKSHKVAIIDQVRYLLREIVRLLKPMLCNMDSIQKAA